MEERTFKDKIDVFKLIESLEKCGVMDDARKLLNDFVIAHTGIEYSMDEDRESGTAYRNSRSPHDIKDETLRVIDDHFRRWNVIDETSESCLNAARKYMDKRGVLYDDSNIVHRFGDMRNNIENVRAYIETWRKEPAIKKKNVKKEISYRYLPKNKGAMAISTFIFNHYKDQGYLLEENRGAWDYVCGISDKKTETPITWRGEWTILCTFISVFLENELYFDFKAGVRKYFICKNGEEKFVQYEENALNSKTLKGTISQSKNNGTLKRNNLELNEKYGINLTE